MANFIKFPDHSRSMLVYVRLLEAISNRKCRSSTETIAKSSVFCWQDTMGSGERGTCHSGYGSTPLLPKPLSWFDWISNWFLATSMNLLYYIYIQLYTHDCMYMFLLKDMALSFLNIFFSASLGRPKWWAPGQVRRRGGKAEIGARWDDWNRTALGYYLKEGYPQSSSILMGFSIINHPALGYPHSSKSPYLLVTGGFAQAASHYC